MDNLQNVFGDLASFSLANKIVNNDNTVGDYLPFYFSLFKSEYIYYIYAGIAILIIIIGFLIYKFNYVKRKSDDNNNRVGSEIFVGTNLR